MKNTSFLKIALLSLTGLVSVKGMQSNNHRNNIHLNFENKREMNEMKAAPDQKNSLTNDERIKEIELAYEELRDIQKILENAAKKVCDKETKKLILETEKILDSLWQERDTLLKNQKYSFKSQLETISLSIAKCKIEEKRIKEVIQDKIEEIEFAYQEIREIIKVLEQKVYLIGKTEGQGALSYKQTVMQHHEISKIALSLIDEKQALSSEEGMYNGKSQLSEAILYINGYYSDEGQSINEEIRKNYEQERIKEI